MQTPRTCLFITETGEDDFAIFANIYCNSEIAYLEIISGINTHLHRHHDKVYYYPDINLATASSIVQQYAEDYPQYIISVTKGVIK